MHEEARRQLKRRLGHEPDPRAWNYLVKKLIVEQYEQDVEAVGPEVALDDLEQEYRDFVEAAGPSPREPSTLHREIPPDMRFKALSKIVALDAAKRHDVRAFRREVLGDRLLTWDQAVEWIENEAKGQQGTHVWAKVPVPLAEMSKAFRQGVDPWAWLGAAAATSPEERQKWGQPCFESDTLDYTVPRDEWVRRVLVVIGSPLHKLERLSARLARTYGWQKAQATMFILTDLPPAIPLARVTIRRGNRFGALDAITLRIPVGVPAKKVVDIYLRARQEIIGRGRRDPAVTNQKTADLALFIARHNDGRTWREAMETWNATQGEKAGPRYSDPRLFARDCRQAYERITGTRLIWGDPEAQNQDAVWRAAEAMLGPAKGVNEDAKSS